MREFSFDTYRECLGMDCQSFRFGDGWINHETLCLVEKLGARFDLTLEPGQKSRPTAHPGKPYTGCIPDLANIPRSPYQFSLRDFRTPDPARLSAMWLIPLSSGPVKIATRRRWTVFRRFCGISTGDLEFRNLNVSFEPGPFGHIMEEILSSALRPYLALVVRSDVATKQDEVRNMDETFSYIISHPMVEQFAFCTPADALQLLALDQRN